VQTITKTATSDITIPKYLSSIISIVGIGIFLCLVLLNLEYSPVPWFDEGEHLRVPKTLVEHGQYAVWTSDGYRYFGPTIGVGPTVLLPIALSFKLFGVGLVQGRLVIVLYLLLATALYWLYVRCFVAALPGVLALLMLCTSPGIDFIRLGRQGLGEIPALAFFLGGLLLWCRLVERGYSLRLLSGASLLWGLATITKSNYGLLLPPVFVIAWLANRYYFRVAGLGWKIFAVPLVTVIGALGVWYLIVLYFLGGGDFASNLDMLKTASGGSAFVLSLSRMKSALYFLVEPNALWCTLVPGILYSLWLARTKTATSFSLFSPLLCAIVWLVWFGFASIGWERYAFPALVLCSLFSARLVWDAPALLATLLKKQAIKTPIALLLGVIFALLFSLNLVKISTETLKVDDSAQRLTAYLNQNVPNSVVIETWESEMGFLTNHRYHSPPPELLDKAVRIMWLGAPGTVAQQYDTNNLAAAYLIDGAFSNWNGLYIALINSGKFVKVADFGKYTLYKKRAE